METCACMCAYVHRACSLEHVIRGKSFRSPRVFVNRESSGRACALRSNIVSNLLKSMDQRRLKGEIEEDLPRNK